METTEFTDKTLMPFGKYKGKPLANVPDEYLIWFYEKNKTSPVYGNNFLLMEYIIDNKETIFK